MHSIADKVVIPNGREHRAIATSTNLRQRRAASLFEERRFLRRLYLWGFALRFSLALLAWVLSQFTSLQFLLDAKYYEEIGASIAHDWLQGRSSTWLNTVGQQPFQPRLMVIVVACFYVLTLGTRLLPLLLGFYCALTSLTPLIVYRIARQLGTSGQGSRLAAWLVAASPAFVFWSGALYKEGLVLLVLALSIHHTLRLQAAWNGRSLVVIILSIVALLGLRLYLALIMGALLCLGLILARSRDRRSSPTVLLLRQIGITAAFATGILLAGIVSHTRQALPRDFEEGLIKLQTSRFDLARTAESGYLQDVEVKTVSDAVSFLPLGVAYFLSVPLPWQLGSLKQNIAIPDTAFWLLLYPVVLIGMVRGMRVNPQAALLLIVASAAMCVFFALYLGNVGIAYRMRVQVWLLWAVFVGMGWDALQHRPLATPQR